MINSRALNDLRPDVRANVEQLLAECARQGLHVLITQTLRDDEYQAMLYAQGRTLPGQIITNSRTTTFHGAGLAIDFCQDLPGQEYKDLSFFANVAIFLLKCLLIVFNGINVRRYGKNSYCYVG